MAFLDELRQHLERRAIARSTYAADLAAHRKHMLSALEEIERTEPSRIPDEHQLWSNHIDVIAEEMGASLAAGLAHGWPREQVTSLINVAISRGFGLDVSAGSRVRDLEIDRIRGCAFDVALGLEKSPGGARKARRARLGCRAARPEASGQASIRDTWAALDVEPDPNRKGKPSPRTAARP